MECFVALVILGFVAVLASGIGLGLGPRGSRGAFQSLTQRFGGSYQGGHFLRPSVRFRYGSTWVTVSPGPKRGQTQTTRAQLQWPDETTYLHVITKSDTPPAPSDVTRRITVGDEQFDSQFHITGRSDKAAQRLLSDGVRWQINALCQFADPHAITIVIRNGKMTIEKPGALRRSDDLAEFTQLCLELFDQAMLTRSVGIEFLGKSDEAQPIEDPICQVCGEKIVDDMVFCRRCRTPHHLDCWQYTGCCSTYGCREKRYAVPAVGHPIDPSDSDSE